MSISLFERVLDRVSMAEVVAWFDLDPPRRGVWRCPLPEGHANGDRSPSASVFQRDGIDLFKCHACGRAGDVVNLAAALLGCSNRDAAMVLAHKAGLAPVAPALRVRPEVREYRAKQKVTPVKDKPLGELVRTYDYTDEDGALLFQVCRFDPKDFRQRRPDGKGGWVWNLRGTRRVLYRLPAVLEALRQGREVWICEGEKDADTLAAQGVCATTAPGGAGKWEDSYTDLLTGASVVVVCDADPAGRSHGEALQMALEGRAGSLRLLVPRQGKDASEAISAGWTVARGFRPLTA